MQRQMEHKGERKMLKELKREEGLWVALRRVEDPGVAPPLSRCISILLLFPLSASPGGLQRLIWINGGA